MKRIKVIAVAAILLLCVVIPLAACSTTDTPRTAYSIVATLDEENKRVDGSVTVDYVNNSELILSEVMFHLYPRAFREGSKFSPVAAYDRAAAYPSGVNYGDLSVLKVMVSGEEVDIELTGEDEDILRVPASLDPTESVEIVIDFRLQLPHVRHRLGYADGIFNLGNFYPIACVIRDGGFDTTPYYLNGDPFNSDVADYQIQMSVPQKYTVAVSGTKTESTEGGIKTVSASIQNARDVAVIIGEFDVQTTTTNGVEINYYSQNDTGAAAHLQIASDALAYFGEAFGDYAYDTLAVVKTPFLYGGMEYPALVYISNDSAISDSLFGEIIVHEIAHQWWYAAVGNDQIREAWLDEGMAEYSTTLFYEANPSYGVTKNARMADALTGFLLYCENNVLGGQGDTSMIRSSPDYRNQQEYACMTYVKGALMLDAVRDTIGDKAFFGGLQRYYKLNKFGRASADDLIGALEHASKSQLKSFMDSWLEGKVKMFAN